MTKTKLKKIEVKTFIMNRLIRAFTYDHCKDEMDAFQREVVLLRHTWQGPMDGINFEFNEILDS